ncbi:MAG: SEC-C domain-containing protein [Chloroflexi bacterium]|nr:SEC-C domain-containing protein [Chloroflexota bacterium]
MFQDLYARIRSQVVTYVFTYQYRGFARLESERRDRESRQAIEAQSPVASRVSQQSTVDSRQTLAATQSGQKAAVSGQPSAVAKQKVETKAPKQEPVRKPVNATVGTKIGRNDPCWCGSGKKYKNCHMASDMK